MIKLSVGHYRLCRYWRLFRFTGAITRSGLRSKIDVFFRSGRRAHARPLLAATSNNRHNYDGNGSDQHCHCNDATDHNAGNSPSIYRYIRCTTWRVRCICYIIMKMRFSYSNDLNSRPGGGESSLVSRHSSALPTGSNLSAGS